MKRLAATHDRRRVRLVANSPTSTGAVWAVLPRKDTELTVRESLAMQAVYRNRLWPTDLAK